MKKFSIRSLDIEIPTVMLEELGIEYDENAIGLDIVYNSDIDGFEISESNNTVKIEYSELAYLFRALSILATAESGNLNIKENSRFNSNGIMIDCSRNAVINIETVKLLIRCIARMGMNRLMLYTEDTYEIPNEPYFGYMRGRYTQEELKEIDEYAKVFGIELVPCIQTLGHLGMALKWSVYGNVKETGNILLIDEPATYELIEKMISSCRDSFTTDIIHIGMDEAEMIGRGNYYLKHGESDKFELICRHLTKVADICKEYGFRPMIWSDMFFKLANNGNYRGHNPLPDEVSKQIPKDVSLVYWEYLREEPEQYDILMKNHLALQSKTVFAGSILRFNSFLPSLSPSFRHTKIALEACARNGIQDVFTTVWGDDGSEASIFSILPVLQLQAEMGFHTDVSKDFLAERLYSCTGASLDDFSVLDMPELDEVDKNGLNNPSKYLLYNDVMLGLYDLHCPDGIENTYSKLYSDAKLVASKNTKYKYIFETAASLFHILELKAEFGKKIKAAYDSNDCVFLERAEKEIIPEIIDRTECFRMNLEKQWMFENKSFGFEVQDIRIGALLQRLKSAANRIKQYREGLVSEIPELAEERLIFGWREGIVNCGSWGLPFTASYF